MKRRRKLFKQSVSVLLTIILTAALLPLDILTGGIAVRADEYNSAITRTGDSDWQEDATSGKLKKSTTWTTAAAQTGLKAGDTLNGIKILTLTSGVQCKDETSGKSISFKPGDVLGIPVSSDAESFELTISLTSSNSNRYVIVGDTASKKIYHGNNSNKTDDDAVFSSRVATIQFNKAGYVNSDGYIPINTATTNGTDAGGTDSGESKIGSITLVEYKTAASGSAVSVQLKSGRNVLTTITGAHDDSKGFNAMASSESELKFSAVPVASDLSLEATTDNVYDKVSELTISVDEANSVIAVKSGTDTVIEIPYSVEGQLSVAPIGTTASYDFKTSKTFFGKDSTALAATTSVLSDDGFVKAEITDASKWTNNNGHGLQYSKQVTFTVKVPANAMAVFTYNDCMYSNPNDVKMYVNDSTDAADTKSTATAETYQQTDGSASFAYKNTADVAVTLKFVTSDGITAYIHSIEYKVIEIPEEATVSGNAGTDAAGGKLVFASQTNEFEATVNTDGSYSVVLPIGSKYTVTLKDVAGYELAAEADLTSAAAGDTITKDFTPVSWNAGKQGKVTIGDTVFAVKAGADKSAAFEITADSGSGRVEYAGNEKAVVWADYGNKTLEASTAAGEGLSAAVVSGNEVALTYSDADTNPKNYTLEVRNAGAAKDPVGDGQIYTSSFLNGSIISKVYDQSHALKNTSITSEDGQITINAASGSGVYYHGTQYGIVMNASDSIDVKVAGNAKVTVSVASFGTTGIEASIKQTGRSRSTGIVYVSDDTSKTQAAADTSRNDPAKAFSFNYEGDAATLSFAMTGGTSYVKDISVQNEAPKGNTNDDAVKVKPELINMANGALTVTEVGQKIVLENAKGSIPSTNIEDSELGMFVFPATSDNNTLTVDMIISEGSSNSNAVLMGLFKDLGAPTANRIRTVTTTIRSTGEVVQLMTKAENNVLGKNSFNGAVYSPGDKVRVTITKNDSKIIQKFQNLTKGTEEVTKETNYGSLHVSSASDAVHYGVMVSKRTATITNMIYTSPSGEVLYDQNAYYDPLGSAPVVSQVEASAAADRTKIDVSWDGTADFDGKFVLQVKKPNSSEWEDVDIELTSNNYEYLVASDESGDYVFRVCGTLGNSKKQNMDNRNSFVESNIANIRAALATPEITIPFTSPINEVEISWTASPGATSYELYRRFDDNAAEKIATVTDTSYKDTSVTAEVPYYYSVKALSADNFSKMSEEKWTLTTDGHSGPYDENVPISITKRSYNTVFENKITLEGVVGAPGTVEVLVNGSRKASQDVSAANGTFSFADVAIEEGRNKVEILLTYGDKQTSKVFNYVYLKNYDYIVDAAFTGTAGTADANGIPQYKTVAEALTAAGSPSSRKIILVRNGDYNEHLTVSQPNISIIGEDSEKTRIHYAVNEGNKADHGNSRYAVTVSKTAVNFTAENIMFENSWVYLGDGSISNESAEAVYCEAPNALFAGVSMISNQDTLQAKNSKQYYLRCFILGNVDFMWGTGSELLFEDCEFKFRYAEAKNSGYYNAFGDNPYVIFNGCRFTSEAECGGTKYYLGRPYKTNSSLAFINCYMGGIINKDWGYSTWGQKELSTDAEAYAGAKYYECGTYGAGYAVNINRRQISQAAAADMITTASLGWDPSTAVENLGNAYKGSIVTPVNTGFVENAPAETDKYSPYEGDDTGLGKYNLEGYAQAADATGGGLLKENNKNYYKVKNGDEFLTALKAIKDKKGVSSVIEVTNDILLGFNEVNAAVYGTGVIAEHNPALVSPVLKESGISKVYIKDMSNLTIFSKNGSSIKHAALGISNSSNVIIRNIKFDELWEWDEGGTGTDGEYAKPGDYDINDWDYVTIENGSNKIWIDHCTFYKSYDGVIDIKTSDQYATPMNITISWCEFLPGSEDNVFFDDMMKYLDDHKDQNPYYKSLLDSGMTKEQIWWYAYGQKKTHLLGQSDSATANVNLNVTFANNNYYNSMDRMPRLRYGNAHVYNCIMDAQELYDARAGITNPEAAKHIVSNGASSTCDGHLLLQNCYVSGIINAMNSGNGSSPSGWINADNSLYYMSGERYKFEPKVNTTKEGEPLKIQDKDEFISNLPYSEYALYDAAQLDSVVKPFAGAGKLSLTTLQWEKAGYIDTDWTIPDDNSDYTNDGLLEFIVFVPDDTGVVPVEGVTASEDATFVDENGAPVTGGEIVIKADEIEDADKAEMEPAVAEIVSAIPKDAKVKAAIYMDISAIKNGIKVNIATGRLTLTLAIPDDITYDADKDTVRVLHKTAAGLIEHAVTKGEGRKISIDVDSLSPFAIVVYGSEEVTTPPDGNNNNDSDGGDDDKEEVTTQAPTLPVQPTQEPSQPSTQAPADQTDSAPTGDRAPIIPIAAAALLAMLMLAGTAAFSKKRK